MLNITLLIRLFEAGASFTFSYISLVSFNINSRLYCNIIIEVFVLLTELLFCTLPRIYDNKQVRLFTTKIKTKTFYFFVFIFVVKSGVITDMTVHYALNVSSSRLKAICEALHLKM